MVGLGLVVVRVVDAGAAVVKQATVVVVVIASLQPNSFWFMGVIIYLLCPETKKALNFHEVSKPNQWSYPKS